MGKIETPWARAKKTQSQRQEAALARREGAERQPRSGALWNRPRDVRWNGFLIEARTTDKGSYTISKHEWQDIIRQALRIGRLPAMQIKMGEEVGWFMRDEDFQYFKAEIDGLISEIKKLRRENG